VAANLAAAYKRLGKRIVIIDLDLRRPSQQRFHAIDSKNGFLGWARSGYPLNDLLSPTGPLGVLALPDGTHLIPAGGSEEQPSPFLMSENLGTLVRELKSHYDVVVIDTPPAGVFQDALILARLAQDRILVAREAKAPVEHVKKTISDFEKASSGFAGFVLNGFNPRAAHQKLRYSYSDNSYRDGYGKPGRKSRVRLAK
jgi:capsular exopolysaccharide synthesis family protein